MSRAELDVLRSAHSPPARLLTGQSRRYAPSAISEPLERRNAALQTATVAQLAKLRFARTPASASPMVRVKCHRDQDDADGPDLLLASGMTGIDKRGPAKPVRACPRLFNKSLAAPDQRAIDSQSVRPSANSPRPERRSTDGQVILKATSD